MNRFNRLFHPPDGRAVIDAVAHGSSPMRTATAAAVAVLAAIAGGCGGGADRHAPAPAVSATPSATSQGAAVPRPLDQCGSAGQGWQALHTTGVYGAPAAHLGSGRLGVVFADDSNDDPCDWSSEARALARQRYAVAVFQTGGGDEVRQALTVAAALRATGAQRIALIGASVGARSVVQAGALHPRGVVALVALSAERRIGSSPSDLLPVGRRVRVPVLSIGSRDDPFTAFGKDTLAWDRTIPHGRALLLDGGDHGVDLLAGRHGPRVRTAILRLLRSL